MSLDSETQFGRILVEQGLVRPEQVDECLREISRLSSEGATPPRAIADATRALELGFMPAWQHAVRGRCQHALKNPKEALAECQKAIELEAGFGPHLEGVMAECRKALAPK